MVLDVDARQVPQRLSELRAQLPSGDSRQVVWVRLKPASVHPVPSHHHADLHKPVSDVVWDQLQARPNGKVLLAATRWYNARACLRHTRCSLPRAVAPGRGCARQSPEARACCVQLRGLQVDQHAACRVPGTLGTRWFAPAVMVYRP